MPGRSPTKIKNNIQATLKMRPMELNELARTIHSDYRATKKYLEELEQLGVVERVKGLRQGVILYQNRKIKSQLPSINATRIKDFVK